MNRCARRLGPGVTLVLRESNPRPPFLVSSRAALENRPRGKEARQCHTAACSFSLAVVADGISSCPFGGSVARWVVANHLAKDRITVRPGVKTEKLLRDYLIALNERFRDEFSDLPEMLASGACLSAAFHCRRETHCFWVGDSPIYETRRVDGRLETELVSHPDSAGENFVTDWFGGTSHFELKHIRLSAQAVICTITSDGAIHDADMLNATYKEHGFSQAVATMVCQDALSQPDADDVSIAAMRFGG